MAKIKAKTNTKTNPKATKPVKAQRTKQRSIRFSPDPHTVVLVNFGLSTGKDATVMGLVLNESKMGFAAVFHTDIKVKADMDAYCRVGQLSDTLAVVRWSKVLDDKIVKVGFEYAT